MTDESASTAQFLQVQVADGHERYVPNGVIDLCAASHLSFYEWVATEIDVTNKRILDLGCGSGYRWRDWLSLPNMLTVSTSPQWQLHMRLSTTAVPITALPLAISRSIYPQISHLVATTSRSHQK